MKRKPLTLIICLQRDNEVSKISYHFQGLYIIVISAGGVFFMILYDQNILYLI